MQVKAIILFVHAENAELPRLLKFTRTSHEIIFPRTATELGSASCYLSSIFPQISVPRANFGLAREKTSCLFARSRKRLLNDSWNNGLQVRRGKVLNVMID